MEYWLETVSSMLTAISNNNKNQNYLEKIAKNNKHICEK